MRGNPHVRFGPGAAGKGPAPCRHLAGVLPVPSGTTISVRRSSRSAPTSRTRSRSGSTATSGPNARPPRPVSDSPSCPTGSPPSTIPMALQAICDRLGPGSISVFFATLAGSAAAAVNRRRPRRRLLVGAVDGAGRGIRARWCSPRPAMRAGFFEALVTDNLDIGRPDTIEIIFDRQVRGGKRATGGEFKTKIVTRGTEVTVNAFYKHSRIKQYLKDGRALRIETVINDPNDLGCQRRLHNLDELQTKARAVNARVLQAERVGQGCVLANPVFERIAHPTVTAEGRRATAMRFGDSRVQALAGALCVTVGAVTGITNRSLRALMTGLLGTHLRHHPGQLRPRPTTAQRPHHPPTAQQHLRPHRRRAALCHLLHQGPRPRPKPALRRRPTPGTTRAARHTAHPRPSHRSTTRPRPPTSGSLKTQDNSHSPSDQGSLRRSRDFARQRWPFGQFHLTRAGGY